MPFKLTKEEKNWVLYDVMIPCFPMSPKQSGWIMCPPKDMRGIYRKLRSFYHFSCICTWFQRYRNIHGDGHDNRFCNHGSMVDFHDTAFIKDLPTKILCGKEA